MNNTLVNENEILKNCLSEIKNEIKYHKDFGTALWWENDILEKIDNTLSYVSSNELLRGLE